MHIDNTPEHKYILIDTTLRPSYAYLGFSILTEYEAQVKNRAFAMNRANKKYIRKEDWK